MVETHPLPAQIQQVLRIQLGAARLHLLETLKSALPGSQLYTDITDSIGSIDAALDILDG